MATFQRSEILHRLRAKVANGKPIVGGGAGTGLVTIRRDGVEVAGSPAANEGSFSEDMGKKASGSYTYEVCEHDGGQCDSDTVTF